MEIAQKNPPGHCCHRAVNPGREPRGDRESPVITHQRYTSYIGPTGALTSPDFGNAVPAIMSDHADDQCCSASRIAHAAVKRAGIG